MAGYPVKFNGKKEVMAAGWKLSMGSSNGLHLTEAAAAVTCAELPA